MQPQLSRKASATDHGVVMQVVPAASFLKGKQNLQIDSAGGRSVREWTTGERVRFRKLWRTEIADGRRQIYPVEDISRGDAQSQVVAPVSCGCQVEATARSTPTAQSSSTQPAASRSASPAAYSSGKTPCCSARPFPTETNGFAKPQIHREQGWTSSDIDWNNGLSRCGS